MRKVATYKERKYMMKGATYKDNRNVMKGATYKERGCIKVLYLRYCEHEEDILTSSSINSQGA